ncbi:MAG: fasciclin domain-containing protein [Gemmatimonadaceae bacterium]|nr:fasciclin domain-containing protein [Gemmatimonadaceae bacterium]
MPLAFDVRRVARLAVLLVATGALAACSDDEGVNEPPPPPNIATLATNTADLSTLLSALRASGLDSTLAGPGPFTVFAPINSAFAALPPAQVQALLASGNRAILRDLLQAHVIPGSFTAAQLRDGQTVTTAEGSTLTIRITGTTVTVNGRTVRTPDVRASNGVVHLIDGVITEGLDAAQRATITPELSTLVSALTTAGLASAVAVPGPITVFAPVNSAFAALPADQIERLLAPANRALLTKVLTYHVVAGRALSTGLTNGQRVVTLSGDTLTVSTQGGVRINNARVTTADIITSNGVVHLLDGVLTENLDIVDVATLRGFSTLVGAVQTAGLTTALRANSTAGLTVFAPTNAAFTALGNAVPSDPTALSNILRLHVIGARALAASLSNGQRLTTLQGATLTVNIAGTAVSLTGPSNTVRVTATDVPARNGVIHVIDAVILPQAPQTITQLAAATADLSTLNTALRAGGLDSTLAGPGPFTVFAPVNSAFAALPVSTVERLLATGNRAILQSLLRYHVVAGRLEASQLRDGQTLTTVNGATLAVRVQGNTVTINGRTVRTADIGASNGVVHLIDGVLTEGINVAQRAIITADLSTLVTALTAADLVGAVSGTGPITVFAPANSAFAQLPADQIERLLAPANRALLSKVLTYHVVSGRVLSTQLTNGQRVPTLQGDTLTVSTQGGVRINNARVTTADIVTSNGVVHIIDGVLTENLDIVDVATLRGFSTLVGAVQTAGLTNALRASSANGLTVFAPTNAAFAALGNAVPSDPTALSNILRLHVIGTRALAASLSNGQRLTTLQGAQLTVNIAGMAVSLTGPSNTVRVTATDVPAKNGVIHVLDAVILP